MASWLHPKSDVSSPKSLTIGKQTNLLPHSIHPLGQKFYPVDKAPGQQKVQHQAEYGDDQEGAAQLIAQGYHDDPRPHFAAGEHSDGQRQAFFQPPVAVEKQGKHFSQVG